MKHTDFIFAGLAGVMAGYIIAKYRDNKEISKAYMLSEKTSIFIELLFSG